MIFTPAISSSPNHHLTSFHGHVLIPLLPVNDAYDGPNAPLVKGVQFLNVFPEGDPALIAIQ